MSLITTGLKATSLDARALRTYDNGTTFTNEYTSTIRMIDSNRTWYSVASSEDGTKLVAVVYNEYIYTSTDSGVNWTARTIAGTKSWSGVASSADGTKLVAVVDGEYIYTSTDSGVSWTERKNDDLRNWKGIASSADGTKLVAVAESENIYTSTDSGVSWAPRASIKQWSCVASSSDGTKIIAGTLGEYLYTTEDGGDFWMTNLSDESRNWKCVASSADGTTLVAGGIFINIFTSTNSGLNWTARDSERWWSGVASSSDGTKLIASEYQGQIYTSINSGESWVARDNKRNWYAVASSADGIKLVAVVETGHIYTIEMDNFQSSIVSIGDVDSNITLPDVFTMINTVGISRPIISTTSKSTVFDTASFYIEGTPIMGTKLTALNTHALMVASGTSTFGGDIETNAFRSYSSGTPFMTGYTSTARNSNINRSWRGVASSADGTKLAAVALGQQIYTSTNSGVDWVAITTSRDWSGIASNSDGTKLAAIVNPGYIYISVNDGASTFAARMSDSNRNWTGIAMSSDGTKMVAVVNGGQIYTSTDTGDTWFPRESNRAWRSVASSADGIKLVAVVDGGMIYTSNDRGLNWNERAGTTSSWRGVASSADGVKLVAVSEGHEIFTSTDSGENWIARDISRNWRSVASSADGTTLVATVVIGQIYTSTDSGLNWTVRDSTRSWVGVASSANGTKLVSVVDGGVIYTIDFNPFRNSLMSIGTNESTISSSGTVEMVNTAGINRPTISATSATTITDSAALYIAGPPIAGTNLTITNLYALNVASGNSRFGGTSRFVGDSQFDGISRFESSTQSTSSSTGAIVCRGGIGLGMGSTGAPPIISWGNNYTVSASNSKQIALYETNSGNLFQYYGFGVSSGQLCYTVDATGSDHVFFAASSISTRTELLRIKGTGRVLFSSGSAANPALAFSSDADNNSGMYLIGADSIGFSAGGTSRWEYNSSRINSTIPIHLLNGSASAPSLSFTNDGSQDTGLYWISDGNVGFTSNGTKRWEYNNTRINSDVRIDASAGIQLKGTGAGGYNGIMTVGNTQNNSSARWGQIYHIAVDSTATSTILATIQSSGLYGGGYLEVILCGTHNTVSGISAKAEIYIAMDGGSITLNTAGGTNRRHPGTFAIAYVGSANQGTLSTLNSIFLSTSTVQIELVTSSQPVNYNIYVRAFFGGSSANTFAII